jgi:hypothetical protein
MPRSGTVLIPFVAAMAFVGADRVLAAVKEPPYVAVVESDGAVARCGPGKSYYATLRLKRGSRVTVRRQDPGGWFMIDPPAGSFSLIRADDVERSGNLGTIKRLDQGEASVRIGSSIDPTSDSVFQRRLSSGERVEIVGEVAIPRRDRYISMLKVRPPKGEYRWIEGTYLAPLGPGNQPENEADPFTSPLRPGRGTSSRQPKIAATPTPTNGLVPIPAVNRSAAAPRVTAPATVRIDPVVWLDQIDSQFHNMVRTEPATWDLAQIEQSYLQLRQQTNVPSIRSQIEMRLSAVEHYKQVKAEYDDYSRLASATSRRDAELAAIESSMAPQNSRPPIGSYGAPSNFAAGYPTQPGNGMPTLALGPTPAIAPTPAIQPGPAVPPTLSVPYRQNPAQQNPVQSGPTQQFASPPAQSSPYQSLQLQAPQAQSTPAPQMQPQSTPAAQMQPQSMPRGSLPGGPVLDSPIPDSSTSVAPASPVQEPDETRRPAIGREVPDPESPTDSGSRFGAGSPTSTANPSTPFTPVPTEAPRSLPPANPDNGRSTATGPPTTPSATAPFGPQSVTGAGPESYPPATSAPPQSPSAFQMQPQSAPAPQMQRMPANPAMMPMSPPRQIRPQGPGGLDGAGIIQRAAMPVPGGPRHVLLSPDGRILAYLYPDRGVNLDAYVGRPMGIRGPRSFRPELRTDLIIVQGMMPVRLLP